jgi:metal-dependent amidase/aminoacylase/carboxypeptidase family protein
MNCRGDVAVRHLMEAGLGRSRVLQRIFGGGVAMHPFIAAAQADIDRLIPDLTAIYQDLHRHPELSMHEVRTAKIAADALAACGFDVTASEDFSVFGRCWNVPYVFWIVGGTDPEIYQQAKSSKQLNAIPSNHSPKYAPVLAPTLKTGLQAMLAAAAAWLCGSTLAA